MKGLGIIVVMLPVALGLSGWATNVHALADWPELGSIMPAGDAGADEADCAKAPQLRLVADHARQGCWTRPPKLILQPVSLVSY